MNRPRYTLRMPSRRFSLRALALPLCAAAPIAVVVLLNALVRPWLAGALGATERQSYIGYRSFDRWWELDAAATAEHPALARFLELSDGAFAMAGLAAAVVCCAVFLALSARAARRRARRAARESA